MSEHTNTIKACAYSLGVNEDTLAYLLPLIKSADTVRTEAMKHDERKPSIKPIQMEFIINGIHWKVGPKTSI